MPRRIKIAEVAPEAIGFKVHLRPQVEALRAQGYEVHAVGRVAPYRDLLRRLGLPGHHVPFTRVFDPLGDLRCLRSLLSIFRRERFDAVHTHSPKGCLLGLLAACLAGVPVRIATIHGYYFNQDLAPAVRRAVIELERFSGHLATHVLSQNQEDLNSLRRHGLAGSLTRCAFLGNGIDLAEFSPRGTDPRETESLRGELGLPPRGPVVGIVARYTWLKGYGELLEAYRMLAPRFPGLAVVAVGTHLGNERHPCDPAQLQRRGGGTWRCLVDREDMPRLYALMDIVVLPSYREGFPRTLMEAAAMGKPVVTTDVAGGRATVVPGETGFLVPPRDAAALAGALARLLEDPGLARRMGERALAHARLHFDEREVCARLISCVKSALGQPAG